jgi:hypothetical protein
MDTTKPSVAGRTRTANCEHMLFKKRFSREDTPGPPASPFADDLDHYYWCARTMDVVGPDGEIVSHPTCHAGRSCFEAERTPIL